MGQTDVDGVKECEIQCGSDNVVNTRSKDYMTTEVALIEGIQNEGRIICNAIIVALDGTDLSSGR